MPRARGITLGEYLIGQVGWRDASRVHGLIVAWALWVDTHHGEAPGIDILAGESDKSRAQWFRYQQAFRKAFPLEESPDRIARLVLREARQAPLRVLAVPVTRFAGLYG